MRFDEAEALKDNPSYDQEDVGEITENKGISMKQSASLGTHM